MDDDNLLIPGQETPEHTEEEMMKSHSRQVLEIFLRLGITQVVLGVAILIGGIIIASSWPDYGADSAAEGIWCGILIIVCGALSITARYQLYSGVVITCLVLNLTSAVLNAIGVVIAAISFFAKTGTRWYSGGAFAPYTALNGGLTACLVINIYLCIAFGKVLSQKKEVCCFGSPMNYGGYAMVYVPPGAEMQQTPMGGAFMAVPPGQGPFPPQQSTSKENN